MPMSFDINTGWAGPVYAVMGAEVLIGKSSGDVPPQTACDAAACQDIAGRSHIDFGGSSIFNPGGDTLTIELQTAQYTLPDGFGAYHAMWKIVGGTGRFVQASGVGFESGPFVAWMDAKNLPKGQYIGEIAADICGVKPEKSPQAASSEKPLTSIPPSAFSYYLRQFSPSVRK